VTHFITGGTGFVGSGIILELIKKSNDKVICLTRPKKNLPPRERTISLLSELVYAYNNPPSIGEEIDKRVIVIEGELNDDPQNMDRIIRAASRYKISRFWHVAASLNYEERYADEIFATNVDGTVTALEMAKGMGAEYFNHFSTAYVAGKNSGIILEEPVYNIESNNVYEQSKVKGEEVIYNARGIKTRIFRPSVVIGHSETMKAINFSGLYGFLRRLVQFRGMMNRVQGGYLERQAIRMNVDPDVPLNFVQVDRVAAEAVHIGLGNTEDKISHLTNNEVPTVKEALNIMFHSAGLTAPLLEKGTEEFNWVDEKFNEKMDFYNSYFVGNKIFSRANSDKALAAVQPLKEYAVREDNFSEHCCWYTRPLLEKRKLLPVTR
jgi:nucleoside-diphosphate-sugar epimerase